MTYHYEFTLAAGIVLAMLCIFAFSRTYLATRRNFSFRCLLAADVITMLFDVISSEMDMRHAEFSLGMLYLVNAVFFLGFIWRSFLNFAFVEALVRERCTGLRLSHRLVLLPVALTTLIVLASYWTGWIFSLDAGSGAYKSGPLYPLIYGNGYLYLILAAGFIVASLRHTVWTRLELVSLIGSCLLIGLGYIVRMHSSPYLVMNAFYTLEMLLIFFAFQNPDLFFSRRMNLFNADAANVCLRELYQGGPFSLLAIAVNDFEENRTLYGGHQTTKGLRLIADFLRQKFPDCYVAYMDEGRFLVLTGEPLDFRQVCHEINERMKLPWHASHVNIYLNVHYAVYRGRPEPGILPHMLDYTASSLRRAEQTNEVVHMGTECFQRMEYEREVRQAIDRAIRDDSIEIYFQPLWGVGEQRMIGAEVLARMNDPVLGFVPPSVFIRTAEQSGTITQLGEQVYEKVCIFAKHHDIKKLGLRRLNVNLSAIQCRDNLMSERLNAITVRHHLTFDIFKFEVTETALVYPDELQGNMDRLIAKGAVFSLDDFGTGYSNLIRVSRSPFKDVKLDMTLVREYFQKKNRLLPSIIGAFKSYGLHVTAEGVETKEMVEELSRLGCDTLQGYYFAKPMPAAEFLQYLAKKNILTR